VGFGALVVKKDSTTKTRRGTRKGTPKRSLLVGFGAFSALVVKKRIPKEFHH
jgi:hypothetical protein